MSLEPIEAPPSPPPSPPLSPPPPPPPFLSLQRSLETEGCPYSLNPIDESSQVDIINWLLAKVRDQRCVISLRDDHLAACRGELNYLESRNEVLSRDKERALKQSSRYQEQERKCSQLNQTLTTRYKQTSDELARHKSQSAHLHTQYVHETRKREKETQRVKERLEQILSDKSKDEKRSLEILNSLKNSRSESGRAKWKLEGKEELEMYQSIIRQYEDKQRDLVTIIDSLRQVLLETDTELSNLLSLSPHTTPPLACEDQWGPVLKDKFEALKEKVKSLAGARINVEDNQVVLDHSFSADDSVLNSISDK